MPTERPAPTALRIGLVVNRFPVLSETFIFNKARELHRRGHVVTLFVGGPSVDTAYYRLRMDAASDLEVVQRVASAFPWRSARSVAVAIAKAPARAVRALRAAIALRGLRRGVSSWLRAVPMAARDLDILHFEFSGIAATHVDILDLVGAPAIVVSCRGTAEQVVPIVDETRRALLARVFEIADRVHCVSDDMVRTASRWGLEPTRAFVNRPAIDPSLFRRLHEAGMHPRLRVISVGRLHWDKGIVYALKAVHDLLPELPVEYSIIGDGPDRTHLLYTADSLGIMDHVRFLGSRASEEVRALLDAADVFLLPTVREGISNAAIEAMALGMAVVSTTTGGMPELISHGETGRLVPPRDPAAIAAELRYLNDHPDVRHRLGVNARARIESDFTLQRQGDVFEREYRELVERSRC